MGMVYQVCVCQVCVWYVYGMPLVCVWVWVWYGMDTHQGTARGKVWAKKSLDCYGCIRSPVQHG